MHNFKTFRDNKNKGGNVMSVIQKIALALTIVGGLNWALIGIFDFNLVTWLLQPGSIATRIVYIVIGVCALFNVALLFMRNHHEFMED